MSDQILLALQTAFNLVRSNNSQQVKQGEYQIQKLRNDNFYPLHLLKYIQLNQS